MENLTSVFYLVVFYLVVAIMLYTFIAVPILMELSLAKPKRTPEGKLRIKADGIILKNVYMNNWVTINESLPKNLCQLYWGLWLGLLLFCIACIAISIALVIIYAIVFPIGLFLGFVPILNVNKEDLFHKYQKYGKFDEKKWIAPWKYIVPLVILTLIYLNLETTINTGEIAISNLLSLLLSKSLWSVIGVVVIILLIITCINKVRKLESWAATKTLLKSIKEEVCPLTELVHKE